MPCCDNIALFPPYSIFYRYVTGIRTPVLIFFAVDSFLLILGVIAGLLFVDDAEQNEEGEDDDVESPEFSLPTDIPWLSHTFPFSASIRETSAGLRESIMSYLPDAMRARRLADIYYKHAAWMCVLFTDLILCPASRIDDGWDSISCPFLPVPVSPFFLSFISFLPFIAGMRLFQKLNSTEPFYRAYTHRPSRRSRMQWTRTG